MHSIVLSVLLSVVTGNIATDYLLRLKHHEVAVANDARGASQEPSFYTQRLDHFSESSPTFLQRYWYNTENFVDGPIFLVMGGEYESSIGDIAPKRLPYDLAKRHKGIVVTLEHRYYGESYAVPDFTTENLRYLSSKQAILDHIEFVRDLKNPDLNLMDLSDEERLVVRNVKVVAIGGSYPGNLAAWIRELYPSEIYAAHSSSGPVLAKEDFYEYAVAVDVAGGSLACVAAWKEIVAYLDAILKSGDRDAIDGLKNETGFSLIEEDADFASAVTGLMAGSIQYGPERELFRDNITIVDAICSNKYYPKLAAQDSSIEERFAEWKLFIREWAFNQPPSLGLKSYNTAFYSDKFNVTDEAAQGRLWWWQTCTEFGYFQIAEPPMYRGSMYSTLNTVEYQRWGCSVLFGNENSVPNVEETLKWFGNGTAGRFFQDKILWVNGDIDPWHYLSFTNTSQSTPEQPILVHPASHCSDFFLGRKNGTAPVAAKINEIWNRWLQ